jgi:hypothetical protein
MQPITQPISTALDPVFIQRLNAEVLLADIDDFDYSKYDCYPEEEYNPDVDENGVDYYTDAYPY